jgi:hypothetical protein
MLIDITSAPTAGGISKPRGAKKPATHENSLINGYCPNLILSGTPIQPSFYVNVQSAMSLVLKIALRTEKVLKLTKRQFLYGG